MNNDLSFVTTNGDIQKVLKRLDKISKLPQEERRSHREEQSYLYAYTNVPGNGYLKNAYKAPAIDQNLKLTNDTLAATAGVAGAVALAETAPAQMAMAGYGGWQIGDGSRDIYQGEYKQGAKKLFWGTLDTAFVGTSQWARAGKLGTIATDTGTAYKAVDTGWNSIAYTKSRYDKFRAGKNTVFGAAEYANTGKLASTEYLDNSKYAAGALKTVDNVANDVAKIERTETISNDAITEDMFLPQNAFISNSLTPLQLIRNQSHNIEHTASIRMDHILDGNLTIRNGIKKVLEDTI